MTTTTIPLQDMSANSRIPGVVTCKNFLLDIPISAIVVLLLCNNIVKVELSYCTETTDRRNNNTSDSIHFKCEKGWRYRSFSRID